MTAKRRATAGKGSIKRLKVKKETIKDLDVKGKRGDVKGGGLAGTAYITCTCACFTNNFTCRCIK